MVEALPAILIILLILIGGILFFKSTADMVNGKYHEPRDLEADNDEFEYGHDVNYDKDNDS